MQALVSSFLLNALDPGTCLKVGMEPGAGLAGLTCDQLMDYMRPWGVTASAIPGCEKIVLHDGLPERLMDKFPSLQFVKMPPVKENAWTARYRMLADFLDARPDIERLFFSDVNDVGVFSDPFAWSSDMPGDMLLVGEEWTKFGANQWFTEKYDQLPGEWRALFEGPLADQYPASAGLIGGRRDVVLAIVRRMIALFDQHAKRMAAHLVTAWDMFALNWLLFTGGPFIGFGQSDFPAGHQLAGARLRNSGSIQVYRPLLPNPFLHDRKEAVDRLPMVYDSWCTSRVLELLRDHPNRQKIIQAMSVPRCWGDEQEHSPIDRTAGLADLVLTMFPKRGRIVETGRGRGVSTELFALLLPEAEIISVDRHDTPEAYPRVSAYPNVKLVQADAIEFASAQTAQTVNAVYSDNDHSYDYLGKELRAWRGKLIRGGVMSGHDYSMMTPDVIRAVADYFGANNPPHRVTSDSSWGYVLL